MIIISPHFSYEEVIKSNIADKMGIDNNVPEELLPKIRLFSENCLEKLRANFNKPVKITSWYRCPALNQMISNNPESQHTKGEAVDFVMPMFSNFVVASYIRDNLPYDQLILENSWIHWSWKPTENRYEVLRTDDRKTYKKGLS